MLRDCQQLVYTELILPSRPDRWGILYRTVLMWTLQLYKNLRQLFFKFGTSYVLCVCSFLTKGHVLVFGRWITWSNWRTSLLCMWGGKGSVFVLFRRTIPCCYYYIRDSLLACSWGFRRPKLTNDPHDSKFAHWNLKASHRRIFLNF